MRSSPSTDRTLARGRSCAQGADRLAIAGSVLLLPRLTSNNLRKSPRVSRTFGVAQRGWGEPSFYTSAGLRAGKYSTTGLGARALQIFGGPGRRPVRARSFQVKTQSGRASHLHETAPHPLPGRCGVRNGAGGLRRLGGFPEPPAEAARVSSTLHVITANPSSATAPRTTGLAQPLSAANDSGTTHPSWAAVATTAAAVRVRATASALTAVSTHNHPTSAGRAAHAHSSDLSTPHGTASAVDLSASVAVDATHGREATGIAARLSSLTTVSTTHLSHQSRPKSQIRLARPRPEIRLDRRNETQPAITPACVGHRPSALNSQEER